MIRRTRNYAPYSVPTAIDCCHLNGQILISQEQDQNVVIFPVFFLSDNQLLPTTEIVRTAPGGELLRLTNQELEDPRFWRMEDFSLVDGIQIVTLLEALRELSSDQKTYSLWRNKSEENREVVIVLEVVEGRQPEQIPSIILPIEQCQRCQLSPTGLHVVDRRVLFPTQGTTPLEAAQCKYCQGLFGIKAFRED